MYIEADAKLSAMETFLTELRFDPGCRPLFLGIVDDLEAIITTGMNTVDTGRIDDRTMRRRLGALRRAIVDLPAGRVADDSTWSGLRDRHQRCQNSFEQLMDAILDRCKHQQSTLYHTAAHRFDASA